MATINENIVAMLEQIEVVAPQNNEVVVPQNNEVVAPQKFNSFKTTFENFLPAYTVNHTLCHKVQNFINNNKLLKTRFVDFKIVPDVIYFPQYLPRYCYSQVEILKYFLESSCGHLDVWFNYFEYYMRYFSEHKIVIKIPTQFFVYLQLHGFFSWKNESSLEVALKQIQAFTPRQAKYNPMRCTLMRGPIDIYLVPKLHFIMLDTHLHNHGDLYKNMMIHCVQQFNCTRSFDLKKLWFKWWVLYLGDLYSFSELTSAYVEQNFWKFLVDTKMQYRLNIVWSSKLATQIDNIITNFDMLKLCGDIESNPGPTQSTLYSFNQKLRDAYFEVKPQIQSGIGETMRNFYNIPGKFQTVFDKLDAVVEKSLDFINSPTNASVFNNFKSTLGIMNSTMSLLNIFLSIIVLGALIYFRDYLVLPSLILMIAYIFGWDRKLIDFVKKFISQQTPQDGTQNSMIAQIIFSILAFIGTGILPGVSFLRKLDLIPKAVAGGQKMHDGAGELINKVLYYYRKYFLKWTDEQLNVEYGIFQEVKEWNEKCEHYTTIEVLKNVAKNPKDVHEIEGLYHQLYRWLSSREWSKMPKECQLIILSRRKQIEDVFRKVGSCNAYNGGPRATPLTIMFSGKTGVGKSNLLFPFAYEVLKMRGCTENYENEVYARNVESEFWDNYCNQLLVIVDDAFQIRDSVGKPNPELMEAIRMSNIAPYQPHMADLQDKGRYFTSEVVIYTTNLESDPARHIHSIHSAAAALRRLAQNAFTVELDEKFQFKTPCSEGCPHCGVSQVVNLCAVNKCKENGPCKVRSELRGFESPFCPHIYVFKTLNLDSESDRPIMTYTWEQLLKYVETFNIQLSEKNMQISTSLTKEALYQQGLALAKIQSDDMYNDDVFHELDKRLDIPPYHPMEMGAIDLTDMQDSFWVYMVEEFEKKYKTNCKGLKERDLFNILIEHPALFTTYERMLTCGIEASDLPRNMIMINMYKDGSMKPYDTSFKFSKTHIQHGFNVAYHLLKNKVEELFESITINQVFVWSASILSIVTSVYGLVSLYNWNDREKKRQIVFNNLQQCESAPSSAPSTVVTTKPLIEASASSAPVTVVKTKPLIEASGSSAPTHLTQIKAKIESDDFITRADLCREISKIKGKPTDNDMEIMKNNLITLIRQRVLNADEQHQQEAEKVISRLTTVREDDTGVDEQVQNKVENGNVIQGSIDSTATELAKALRCKNMYRMVLVFSDENALQPKYTNVGNIVFVSGTTVLLPYHYILKIKALQREKRYFKIHLLCASGANFILNSNSFNTVTVLKRGDDEVDACMCYLDPRETGVRIHPRIINNFVSNKDLTALYNNTFDGSLVSLSNWNSRDVAFSTSYVSNIELKLRNKGSEELEMEAYDEIVKVADYWMYCGQTENGDCGSLLVLYNSALQHKIMGIHQSGSPGLGFAQVITQEMLTSNVKIQAYMDFEGIKIDSQENRNENICHGLSYIGKLPRPIVGATKSKICPSPLYDKLPRTTTPAKLYYSGEDNPMQKGLLKYATQTPFIDITLVNFCNQHLRNAIDVGVVKTNRMEYARILTNEEAVVGVNKEFNIDGNKYVLPDCYLAPINRKTSPGYPYCHQFPGKNKHFWFGEDEWDLQNERAQAVLKDVDSLIEDAKTGKVQPVIWIDTLKDERRPLAKVAENKTRVFSAGPQHFVIGFRKYTLGLSAWLMHNRIFNGFATGVNVYSNEWSNIVKLLHAKGKNILAGDFSNFDGSQSALIMWAVVYNLLYFYRDEKCGGNCKQEKCMYCNDQHPEHIAFITLFVNLINACHGNYQDVWQAIKSLPSGNPITAIFNTAYLILIVSMCFFLVVREEIEKVCKELKIEVDPSETFHRFMLRIEQLLRDRDIIPKYLSFLIGLLSMRKYEELVKVIGYGDDSLISVHDSIIKIFNQTTLTQAMAKIGHTYTDEMKSTIMHISRTINDVSFLKRKFVKRGVIYDAPLSLDTVLDIVQFTKKGFMGESIFRSNVDIALRELSLHDEDVFDLWKTKIQNELISQNINIPLLSYREYRLCVLNNAMFVESGENYCVALQKGIFSNDLAHIKFKYKNKSEFLFHKVKVLLHCQSVCLNSSVYTFDFSIFKFDAKQKQKLLVERQNLKCSFNIKF